MLSLSWKSFDDRCLLRNCTPLPMDFDREGRGKDALNGSKSSSRTKLLLGLQYIHQKYYKLTYMNKAFSLNKIKHGELISQIPSLSAKSYPSSTSCSLNCRYSGTLSSSTASSLTLTLTYSQTPGLGRMASATHGGITIASCKTIELK